MYRCYKNASECYPFLEDVDWRAMKSDIGTIVSSFLYSSHIAISKGRHYVRPEGMQPPPQ